MIDYRRLTTDPKGTIEDVYRDLGLDITPAYAAFLEAEAARTRRHETEHRYSLAEFGLDDQEIRVRLGPLFEEFQWDDTVPAKQPDEKEASHA